MEKYLVKTVNNIEADASGNVDGNSLGFIPLSGTTVGNPVTGNIEFELYGNKGITTLNSNGDAYNSIQMGDASIILESKQSPSSFTKIEVVDSYGECLLSTDNPNPIGFSSTVDCTPYIGDLDYTQKKYVDEKSPSVFGQATLTAGSVTIPNTNIQSTSIIICTANGTTDGGFISVTKNSGVGFTIESSNILDGRTVDYIIKY